MNRSRWSAKRQCELTCAIFLASACAPGVHAITYDCEVVDESRYGAQVDTGADVANVPTSACSSGNLPCVFPRLDGRLQRGPDFRSQCRNHRSG